MEHYLQQLNLTELMQQLDSFFPSLTVDPEELLERIMAGEWGKAAEEVLQAVFAGIGEQILGMKNLLASILILGVLSVLVTSFLTGFENHQTAQIGYTVFYLLLLAILFRIFAVCYEIAGQLLIWLGQFCSLVFPALCLSVSAAAGSLTAAGYYQLALALIAAVELFLGKVCLPALSAFMLLLLMNGIWEEGKLSALMELVEKMVTASLKFSMGAVTGISVLQSMVAPVLDSLKRTAAQKAAAAIPGLGELAEGTTQLLLGSALLVKNSVGLFCLLLLLFLTALPCLKLFLYGLLLKVSGALIGVVADKRLTGCVIRTGDVIFLMLRLSLSGTGCFVVLIAVLTCLVGK